MCKSCSKKGNRNPLYGIWGEKSANWRGGYIRKNGYRYIQRQGKGIYEHRWVMEQHLGRKLLSSEHVHHINGVKIDNNIENLEIVTSSSHQHIHHANKTECKKGHIYSDVGFYIEKNGSRRCRQCRLNGVAKYRAKKRLEKCY